MDDPAPANAFMSWRVALVLGACLVQLTVPGCSSSAFGQLSPDEKQLSALAQIVFEVEEANTLLPASAYDAQTAAMQGIKASECAELTSAEIDLRIARSKRETTEALQLLSAARLVLSTARLSQSKGEAGSSAAMERAVEQLLEASIQAEILRNRNSGPDYSKALADVEVAQAVCMTVEQYRARTRLETLKNQAMISILGARMPLLRSLQSKVKVQELLDSAAAVDSRKVQARKQHPQGPRADEKLKALGSSDDPQVVASRKAFEDAVKKAARSK